MDPSLVRRIDKRAAEFYAKGAKKKTRLKNGPNEPFLRVILKPDKTKQQLGVQLATPPPKFQTTP